MARTTTKTSTAVAAAEHVAATESNKEVKTEKIDVRNTPLLDTDEIEVESLIPNVSYKDSRSGEMYEWDVPGHVEFMNVETLKNLWRNYKGYFRNLWLKPNDERVIKLFSLGKIYDKYNSLFEASNYTRDNIEEILDEIASCSNSLKSTVINKIIEMVDKGDLTDVRVLRSIEKRFGLDLISLL